MQNYVVHKGHMTAEPVEQKKGSVQGSVLQ